MPPAGNPELRLSRVAGPHESIGERGSRSHRDVEERAVKVSTNPRWRTAATTPDILDEAPASR